MYLFTRSARLGVGRFAAAMGWAGEITEKANQIGELEFSLWAPTMSPGVTRLVWVGAVEDLTQLEATQDKLLVDPGYLALLDQGAEFASGDPIDDQLVQLIHVPAGPEVMRDARYVVVVQAMAANGNFGRGVEVGVGLAQAIERITGVPTNFGVATTGSFGQVMWTTGFPDIASLQRSEQTLNADTGFLELLDTEAATAYLPGQATQIVYRRLV